MWTFDSSSFILAWHHYPINQFPLFWHWLQQEVRARRFMVAGVAFEEIQYVEPECSGWLRECGIRTVMPNQEILARFDELRRYLRTEYTGDGVDQNDLVIISTAKYMGGVLVSEEAVQTTLPAKLHNYKIPAVCNLPRVRVECIQLIDLIVNSGQVFG